MKKNKVVVIGAGFAGATVAYLLSKKYEVTVVEAASSPGGGCETKFISGHPYTFGPRVFFSRDDEVISLLTSLIKIRNFNTVSWTYVEQDGNFYNYPIQYSDIPLMQDSSLINAEISEAKGREVNVQDFESYWLSAIGKTLYGKFVDKYSKKMWGVESNKNLLASFEWVNKGIPIRSGDKRLYQDQFQGYPVAQDGYNGFFERALSDVTVRYGIAVKSLEPQSRIVTLSDDTSLYGDVIINTVPVDSIFCYTYGKLLYSGRTFIPVVLPIEQILPDGITWIHYSGSEPYTRITEFKKITNHYSPHTLIGIELPNTSGRYYPVQTDSELVKFDKYKTLFPSNFYSIGRHGSFRYKGIPDAIRDAIDTARSVG